MSTSTRNAERRPERQRFLDQPDAFAPDLLRLLLAQDGSTTRLCETVAGGPVELLLLHQVMTADVPPVVRDALPGEHFIERVTSLAAHGEVMMDNLSYIALDGLPRDVQADLEAGRLPIGHLLARLWVKRAAWQPTSWLFERLDAAVGVRDDAASRAYRILTPDGPSMLIAETFRRGMRMRRFAG